MEDFSSTQGYVFTLKYNGEDSAEFDPLKAVQFQMQQWILDNKYTSSTVNDMGGLSFKEHEQWEGSTLLRLFLVMGHNSNKKW